MSSSFARACSLAATMRSPPASPAIDIDGSRLECEVLHAMPWKLAGEAADSGNIASACDSLNGSRNMSASKMAPPENEAPPNIEDWQTSC